MRIFLSCLQSIHRHNVPAYSFWETYFKKGIEEAGDEWIEAENIDWAEGLVYFQEDDLERWRDRTWSRVLDFIKQQHEIKPIDIFLSYLFPKQVDPSAIKEIQALGIPCVNFFCDNVREFTKVPKEFFCFDLHWVPEFKALKMYQEVKLNYIYAPMPVWIPPEQRTHIHSENYGISFIGSRDAQREALLASVIQCGVALEIRGAAWSTGTSTSSGYHQKNLSFWQTGINQWKFINSQGIVPWARKIQAKFQPRTSNYSFTPFVRKQPNSDEYVAIIQQSMICLGINRYPSYHYPFQRPDTYSRMRDIEAPMMGACYLTEWTEGLDHFYELGEEIETYRCAEEIVEKIQKLKTDEKLRQRMRYLAQKRALEKHTISRSIYKIWQAIK